MRSDLSVEGRKKKSTFMFLKICVSKSWMDDSPVVFQAWSENQPNFQNNDENCVAITPSKGE